MNTENNKPPYVGPRTFEPEERDRFFGREREARDLFARVVSERLVLFYAQSGAGKSSLVNTCLIPDLKARNYVVFPVGRVGGEALPGTEVQNIFVFNLINSLTKSTVKQSGLTKLSITELVSKLTNHVPSPAQEEEEVQSVTPHVLVIDQFEELFSTHAEAWEKREDFFQQFAQAMEEHPYLRVVLVMREDYIASLDPYAHLLPGRLGRRYYMQRLEREAAIKAVRGPVEKLRPFAPGVAEKLVDDLSSIKVQKLDGTQGTQPGQYVEPVQLQVVCHSLWKNLAPGGTSITDDDLSTVGDVDQALGKYYAERVAGVAEKKDVKERLIREWIEKKLIAPGGIRSMVLRETGSKSDGLRDDIIQQLQSDLVRAENRGGAIWYELTHDRLVGPILENNKKWFDENLSLLQRQASVWNSQERDKSLLLRDQALVDAVSWAGKNELTDLEGEFLEASQKEQQEAEERRAMQQRELEMARNLAEEQAKSAEQARRLAEEQEHFAQAQARSATRSRRISWIALVLFIFALFAAGIAVRAGAQAKYNELTAVHAQAAAQSGQATAQAASTLAIESYSTADAAKAIAEDQASRALTGSLAAQADSVKNSNYPLALLLGIEAYQRDQNLLTRTTLFQLLQFTPYARQFDFDGPVSSVAVSPDGKWIATASCRIGNTKQCTKGNIRIFDANMQAIQDLTGFGIVYSLAFHQYSDKLVLAAGGCVPEGCAANRGQVTFWNVSEPKNPVLLSDTENLNRSEFRHTALVKTIAFSPDGKLLASGSYDTTILLWDVTDLQHPVSVGLPLSAHYSFVNSLAFSPDGKFLASASDDRSILLWDVSDPKKVSQIEKPITEHTAPVNSILFSPDGKKFASASNDNTILLWDWDSGTLTNPKPLKGHTGYLTSLAFNADGALLASAGFDSKIILWDAKTDKQIGPALSVHTSTVNSVAFGVKNVEGNSLPYLISGSNDQTLIQWDLSAHEPVSYTLTAQGNFSADNQVLSASNNQFRASATGQQVDVSSLQSRQRFLTLDGFDSPVQYVEFDGPALLTIDQNQMLAKRATHWNIDDAEWVNIACQALKRNLTSATWKQFLGFLAGQPPKQKCVAEPVS